jgi:hypothetical protein
VVDGDVEGNVALDEERRLQRRIGVREVVVGAGCLLVCVRGKREAGGAYGWADISKAFRIEKKRVIMGSPRTDHFLLADGIIRHINRAWWRSSLTGYLDPTRRPSLK